MKKEKVAQLYNSQTLRVESILLILSIGSMLDKNGIENHEFIANSIIHQIKNVVNLSENGVNIRDLFDGVIHKKEVNIPLIVERLDALEPYKGFMDKNGNIVCNQTEVELPNQIKKGTEETPTNGEETKSQSGEREGIPMKQWEEDMLGLEDTLDEMITDEKLFQDVKSAVNKRVREIILRELSESKKEAYQHGVDMCEWSMIKDMKINKDKSLEEFIHYYEKEMEIRNKINSLVG